MIIFFRILEVLNREANERIVCTSSNHRQKLTTDRLTNLLDLESYVFQTAVENSANITISGSSVEDTSYKSNSRKRTFPQIDKAPKLLNAFTPQRIVESTDHISVDSIEYFSWPLGCSYGIAQGSALYSLQNVLRVSSYQNP